MIRVRRGRCTGDFDESISLPVVRVNVSAQRGDPIFAVSLQEVLLCLSRVEDFPP